MSAFEGRLWPAGEPGSAIPIRALIEQSLIRFESEGAAIAEWPTADISIRRKDDGFHIVAGPDHVVFHTTQTGFVAAVTGTSSGTVSDRIRAGATARQANVDSETDHSGSVVTRPNPAWTSWVRLALLAAFLFPFITVTCLGEPVASVSGAQAALGIEPTVAPKFSGQFAQESEPDPVMLVALVLAGAATIGGVTARYSRRLVGWMSIGSALAVSYWWFNAAADLADVDAVGFDVRTEPALWLVVLGGAAVGAVDLAVSQSGRPPGPSS